MSNMPLRPVTVCVLVPSVSTAPAVAPLMFSVARLLLRSEERRVGEEWFSAMAVPSTTVAATGEDVGGVGLTVTASVLVVVVLRLPLASFSVAATVSVKLLSFAGLTVSVYRFQA